MNILIVLIIYFTAQITTQNQPKQKINITSTSGTSTTTVTNNISVNPTEDSEDDTLTVSVTTETLLTTACEGNSSCFVSTEKPELNSSVALKNDSRSGDILYQQGRSNYKTSGVDLCTCNLQRNFCDINCCCDEDCSINDKSIFNHCEPENFYYDTRYCDYMKYIYINNTPFQWHVNQNGLFCILKSNLPPSHTVQRKHPLKTFADAEVEKVNKFSWQRNFESKELSFNPAERFVYGSNIWMVHKNGIKKFQLPKNFISGACIIKEDIMNLKNIKNVCSQTDISEENKALNFSSYFQNISVIAAPNLVNVSKYKNFFLECPRNICMPLFPRICEENFSNCKNVSKNSTNFDVKCIFDIRNNKNHCKNVVKKIQFNFYHNSTKGYIKVEVNAVLEDFSYEFEDIFEYYQEFTVQFWWTNQTTNFSAILSGNPGYLIGKPVLIGHLINKGNETNVSLKIERFSNDYIKTFLTVPENINGRCVLNRTTYTAIEFGYNYLSKCKFSGIIVNRKKYLNGSEICRNLQKTILNLWEISEKNKTIGMFGNADANNSEDWIKILYEVSPQELLKKTTGKFDAANTSLTCLGLVTNLVIDIYHSKIDFEQILNQEKILAVTYTFGGFVNKTLAYNKQKNNTYFQLILENQVAFYDISRQKQKKFVDPPSLEIKLPYDFFYPFVKIENSVNIAVANVIFNLCLCFIVVLF